MDVARAQSRDANARSSSAAPAKKSHRKWKVDADAGAVARGAAAVFRAAGFPSLSRARGRRPRTTSARRRRARRRPAAASIGARARPRRVLRSSVSSKNRTRLVLTSRRAREVSRAHRSGPRHCARRAETAYRRPTRRRRRPLHTALNTPWRKSASSDEASELAPAPGADAGDGGSSNRTPAVPGAPAPPSSNPSSTPPRCERSQPPMLPREGDAVAEPARRGAGGVECERFRDHLRSAASASSIASPAATAASTAPLGLRRGDALGPNDIERANGRERRGVSRAPRVSRRSK